MVQLVMTFCLLANHASCIVQRPMLDDAAGPMGCLTAAQPMAAEFLSGHPEYVLASWRCQIGQRAGRSA